MSRRDHPRQAATTPPRKLSEPSVDAKAAQVYFSAAHEAARRAYRYELGRYAGPSRAPEAEQYHALATGYLERFRELLPASRHAGGVRVVDEEHAEADAEGRARHNLNALAVLHPTDGDDYRDVLRRHRDGVDGEGYVLWVSATDPRVCP